MAGAGVAEGGARRSLAWPARAASSEYRLLCSLSPQRPRPDRVSAVLDDGLPWREVLDLAAWHRLEALLLAVLSAPAHRPRVPASVFKQLEAAAFAYGATRAYCDAELSRVLEVLRFQGIPVVLLKGAALARSVYPSPELRPMSDLDLLVPAGALDRADRLVRALGYAPEVNTATEEVFRRERHHRAPLTSPDGLVTIELHHHVIRPGTTLSFPLEGFWQRAEAASAGGESALQLSPEDLLTHLCLHFMKDRRVTSRGALGQLYDIHETQLYYLERLDWPALMDRARTGGSASTLGWALASASGLLDTPLPSAVRGVAPAQGPDLGHLRRFLDIRVLRRTPAVSRRLGDDRTPRPAVAVAARALAHLLRTPGAELSIYRGTGSGAAVAWRCTRRVCGLLGRMAAPLLHPRELFDDCRLQGRLDGL